MTNGSTVNTCWMAWMFERISHFIFRKFYFEHLQDLQFNRRFIHVQIFTISVRVSISSLLIGWFSGVFLVVVFLFEERGHFSKETTWVLELCIQWALLHCACILCIKKLTGKWNYIEIKNLNHQTTLNVNIFLDKKMTIACTSSDKRTIMITTVAKQLEHMQPIHCINSLTLLFFLFIYFFCDHQKYIWILLLCLKWSLSVKFSSMQLVHLFETINLLVGKLAKDRSFGTEETHMHFSIRFVSQATDIIPSSYAWKRRKTTTTTKENPNLIIIKNEAFSF